MYVEKLVIDFNLSTWTKVLATDVLRKKRQRVCREHSVHYNIASKVLTGTYEIPKNVVSLVFRTGQVHVEST